MTEIIRLVVCQIECHPAFYRDRLAFMEEPFMPDSYKSSLSYLGSLGIPTTDMQELFKREFLEWHKKRLEGLLTHPLLLEGRIFRRLRIVSTVHFVPLERILGLTIFSAQPILGSENLPKLSTSFMRAMNI